MNYNEQTRKILSEQLIRCEDNENIFKPLVKDCSGSIFHLVTNAYYLGLINGKQAERSKRHKQVAEV